MEAYKQQARNNLTSNQGEALRKQRNYDVEAVFGQLKRNVGHYRFRLRGLANVILEFGLLSIAYNLKKWFEQMKALPKAEAQKAAIFFQDLFVFFFLKYRKTYSI